MYGVVLRPRYYLSPLCTINLSLTSSLCADQYLTAYLYRLGNISHTHTPSLSHPLARDRRSRTLSLVRARSPALHMQLEEVRQLR